MLAEDPVWTNEKLDELIKSGDTKTIWLRHPVPVHLLYMTAWADGSRGLQFRNDIYHRDEDLQLALNQRRPKPSEMLTTVIKQKS